MKVLIDSAQDPMLMEKEEDMRDFWSIAFNDNKISDIDYSEFDNMINLKYLYANKLSYHWFKKEPINIFKKAEKEFIKKISKNKYDLIFILKGEYIRGKLIDKIRKIQPKAKIINMFPDNPFYYPHSLQAIKKYDLFFVKDTYFLEELKKVGCNNCHYLPQAFSLKHHKKVDIKKINTKEKKIYGSEISFIGSIYPKRKMILKQLGDYDIKLWGKSIWDTTEDKAWILKRHMNQLALADKKSKIFNLSKINLNTMHHINDIKGTNSRCFEICGSGGFQIAEHKPDIEDLFKENKEIVMFKNIKDLKQKVAYYLENDKERENISEAGYKRAIKDHSYHSRLKVIMNKLGL